MKRSKRGIRRSFSSIVIQLSEESLLSDLRWLVVARTAGSGRLQLLPRLFVVSRVLPCAVQWWEFSSISVDHRFLTWNVAIVFSARFLSIEHVIIWKKNVARSNGSWNVFLFCRSMRIIEFFQLDWVIDHKAETVLMSQLKTHVG